MKLVPKMHRKHLHHIKYTIFASFIRLLHFYLPRGGAKTQMSFLYVARRINNCVVINAHMLMQLYFCDVENRHWKMYV